MNNYHSDAEALRDYAAVTYEVLHSFLIKGLCYWYKLYLPCEEPSEEGGGFQVANVDGSAAPVEQAREGDVVCVDTAPPPDTFNMVFLSVAASAAPAASTAPAADAGAAPAADAGVAPTTVPDPVAADE
jgi:hypothetical protein